MQRLANAVLLAYYVLLFTFPALLVAQSQGLPSRIVPCNGVDCTLCDLATLAQNLINTGIFMAVFASAMLFSFAGFLYLTNAALGAKDRARKIFTNVPIGLAIMLAAWLVIDTLMKSVLGGSFGPWNDVCRFLTP